MKVVALSGGVGGQLAHGLYQALELDTLTLIVNTGDDFDHYGLHLSRAPDTGALHARGNRQRRRAGA